jgi:hypothetical protein
MVWKRHLANVTQIAQEPQAVFFRTRLGDKDIVWLHVVVVEPSTM